MADTLTTLTPRRPIFHHRRAGIVEEWRSSITTRERVMWSWLFRRPEAKHEVVLYTRQGCHLCEQAWTKLVEARKRYPFVLREVDVDTDPELVASYGLEVPVVTLDGQVRFRGLVNEVLLHRLLRRGHGRRTPNEASREPSRSRRLTVLRGRCRLLDNLGSSGSGNRRGRGRGRRNGGRSLLRMLQSFQQRGQFTEGAQRFLSGQRPLGQTSLWRRSFRFPRRWLLLRRRRLFGLLRGRGGLALRRRRLFSRGGRCFVVPARRRLVSSGSDPARASWRKRRSLSAARRHSRTVASLTRLTVARSTLRRTTTASGRARRLGMTSVSRLSWLAMSLIAISPRFTRSLITRRLASGGLIARSLIARGLVSRTLFARSLIARSLIARSLIARRLIARSLIPTRWLPLFAAGRRRAAFLWATLAAGFDHRERDAMPLSVHGQHPDTDHVTDRHHVVRTLDIAVGHLADVNQTAVLQSDVDEGAEIDHVQDGSLQFHPGLEILELEDALLEHGGRQIFSRVSSGARKSIHEVEESREPRFAIGWRLRPARAS